MPPGRKTNEHKNMKNINLNAILLQWIGIIFFINGIQRLYLFSQDEKYSCFIESIRNPKNNCWEKLNPSQSLGDYMSNFLLWFFYAFILGIIILSILNWLKKIYWINTVLVLILTFILFPLKFFREGFGCNFFNSFWGEFTENVTAENGVRGIIFTIIGIMLFTISLNKKQSTAHNTR